MTMLYVYKKLAILFFLQEIPSNLIVLCFLLYDFIFYFSFIYVMSVSTMKYQYLFQQ